MPLAAQQFTSSDGLFVGHFDSMSLFDGLLHVLVAEPEISEVDSKQVMGDVRRFFLGKEMVRPSDIRILLADLKADWNVVVLVFEMENQILFGNVGGYVWMKKGDKCGFLSKKLDELVIKKGLVESGDVLVFGFGEDMENLSLDSLENLVGVFVNKSMGVMLSREEDKQADDVLEDVVELKPSDMKIHESKKKKRKGWWQKFLARKPKTANPEVYIKNDERRKLGRIAVLVLLLLITSIGMGWQKRRVMEREDAFNTVYEPALQLLVKAEGLAHETPVASREILLEAKGNVEESLLTYKENDGAKNKLETLLSQINILYEEVSGEHVVSEADVYFDLTVVKDDVFGEQMSVGDGWISVLDTSRNLVIGIEQESKKAQLLGGGDLLSGSKLLSASTGKAVVLSKKGLVGLYFGSREPGVLVEYEGAWERPSALGMFGGNVYLVDSGVEEMWRYPGYDGGVGSRVRWLGPGVLPRLSETIDMSVDGDIWTLSSGGGIAHFRRGAQMNFSVSGMNLSLDGVTKIYARLEKDEVYLLDPPHNRVVVISKKGEYRDQYVWGGIKGASDLVVMDKEGEEGIILLLSGSTIYQIPIGI